MNAANEDRLPQLEPRGEDAHKGDFGLVLIVVLWLLVAFRPQVVVLGAQGDEAALIRRMVRETQRAGHIQGDLRRYMSLWSSDARIIGGRSEKPGSYDTAMDRSQIEATRRLRFAAGPRSDMKVKYDDAKIEVMLNRATLTHRATITATGYIEVVREVYRLKKTDKGWKAYENRWWPVKMGRADSPVEYTKEAWQLLDKQVETAIRWGDPAGQVRAMMSAFRYAEALQAAKKWTSLSPERADAWLARGNAAVFSGDAGDAKTSFRKALALDPEIDAPAYARKIGVHVGSDRR